MARKQIANILDVLPNIAQIEQRTDDWYEHKKNLISATEVPTILNSNPFQTLNELYYNKCHPDQVRNKESRSTQWGTTYEPVAIKCFCDRHENVVDVVDLGLAIHPGLKFLGASPDGLIIYQDTNQTRDLWLIEIKCLHSRQITQELPVNYWLQIQTQLYVWKPIFEQHGYNLRGCIYCENEFEEITTEQYQKLAGTDAVIGSNGLEGADHSYYKLSNYWEQVVYLDENYYTSTVLPEVRKFKDFVDNGRNAITVDQDDDIMDIDQVMPTSNSRKRRRSGSKQPRKRRRSAVDEDEDEDAQPSKRARKSSTVYFSYLDSHRSLITQKEHRNFVNKEPLLDWLNTYGDRSTLPLDERYKYDIKSFVFEQYKEFRQKVLQHIIDTVGADQCITVSDQTPQLDKIKLQSKTNTRSASRTQLDTTISLINQQCPVIINGVLFNPDNNKLGYFDLIIKNSHLCTVFPMTGHKLEQSKIAFNKDDYTFVQIKYSTLRLCAKNTYVLNTGSQRNYKNEQIHLHQVFEYYQPNTNHSFIMGRKSSYTKAKVHYKNYNAFNSFGVVELEKRDKKVVDGLGTANAWLLDVKKNGEKWSVDPPNKPELYPNLKNTQDYPWRAYKTELAQKNRDLTNLWYVGPAERTRLWSIGVPEDTKWDELDPTLLKYNNHYKSIIRNTIEANKTGIPINLSQLRTELKDIQSPIEFYLDFEFVNDLNDNFARFPQANSLKYIYMIGMVYVNHETREVRYYNYLLGRLDKSMEINMINTWLREMDTLNNHNDSINIYHWGMAEKLQIEDYLISQNLLADDIDVTQMDINGEESSERSIERDIVRKLNLIDICELFKNFEVGVPGCFGFGVKEIAKTFHSRGWIRTIWPDNLTGEDAMIAAYDAEKECESGKYSQLKEVPLMVDFVKYNYVDCKVMEEIVSYVRDTDDLGDVQVNPYVDTEQDD
jgi:putative phage-type endonuclease